MRVHGVDVELDEGIDPKELDQGEEPRQDDDIDWDEVEAAGADDSQESVE